MTSSTDRYGAWTDPPSPPIRYRWITRLRDALQGRWDGRHGIPRTPRPDGTAGLPQLTQVVQALRMRAAEQDEQELLECEWDCKLLREERNAVEQDAATLEVRLADARQRLAEAKNEPSADELDTRRIGELGADRELRRPLSLVRQRRMEAWRRKLADAERHKSTIEQELAKARLKIAHLEEVEEALRRVAASRARRVHAHLEQRIAVYLSRLLRSHGAGPELNELLDIVDSDLPEWAVAPAQEPADVQPADVQPADVQPDDPAPAHDKEI
jgi:hypothetical protein